MVKVRDYNPNTDTSFIYSTWLKGVRWGNSEYTKIPEHYFFKTYQKIVEEIMQRPNLQLKLACFKDDPEVILAYIAFEGSTLHWAFTKPAWRKMGLYTLIAPKDFNKVTHATAMTRHFLPKEMKDEPYL